MNLTENLLLCLAEEGGEVSQAAGKAGRFGLSDRPPSGGLPNNEYIVREVNDVIAVVEMLKEHGSNLPGIGDRAAIELKKSKMRHFIGVAEALGTLERSEFEMQAIREAAARKVVGD